MTPVVLTSSHELWGQTRVSTSIGLSKQMINISYSALINQNTFSSRVEYKHQRQRDEATKLNEGFIISPSDLLYSLHFFKSLQGLMSASAVLDFTRNTNSYELIHFLFYLAYYSVPIGWGGALEKVKLPKGRRKKRSY